MSMSGDGTAKHVVEVIAVQGSSCALNGISPIC